MGETRLVLSRELVLEPGPVRPSNLPARSKDVIFAVLLDNIRSAWNVGSILRSADGFGFSYAHLCGITPTPENEAVTRTSLGAEDTVTWSYHKDAVKLAHGLKKEGWQVLALEETERAKPIQVVSVRNADRIVLIVGSEVTGVDPDLLALSDEVLHIPMHGGKRSFNVAVAFGIAAYAIGQSINR